MVIKALCEYSTEELRHEIDARAGEVLPQPHRTLSEAASGYLDAFQPSPGASGLVDLAMSLQDAGQTALAVAALRVAAAVPPAPLKLDLGCGKNKKEGFVGVDAMMFDGVDVVTDLALHAWPWNDGTIEEAHCSHMLEHVPATQRPHFFNELHRVLKPNGRATIITPHWCSNRAYGDLTHEWPPVSEMFYWYLNAKWRAENAPHQTFWTCDFDAVQPGYSMHPALQVRSQDYRDLALTFGKEAAQDMICTVIKRA